MMNQAQAQQFNCFHAASKICHSAPNMNYNPFRSQVMMNSFPGRMNYEKQSNLPHNSKAVNYSGFNIVIVYHV